MMKNAAWEYYDSSNDEEFILRYLNNYIVGLGMDKEGFKKYFNENSLLNILLQNDLNDKFYANVYIILYNVLLNFKNDLTLIDDFFFLRVKYDLRLHYDYTNNSDVKQFFDKLYLINSKIDK